MKKQAYPRRVVAKEEYPKELQYDEDDSNLLSADESRLRMSVQKYEMIEEFDENRKSKHCCSTCKSVTQYMCSESIKKPTAFKIGVFTVFLVVMCITMLKSVVDSSPILFVKIGQSEVGAFDFTLNARAPILYTEPGNMNYYDINPFHGLFGDQAPDSGDTPPEENGGSEAGDPCTFWPED